MDPEQRDRLASYGAPVLAEVEALERALPPPLWARVAALLVAVDIAADNAGAARLLEVCDTQRNRVLAHFGPDWARLYAIVQEHIDSDFLPNCVTPGRVDGILSAVCTLATIDPWVHAAGGALEE